MASPKVALRGAGGEHGELQSLLVDVCGVEKGLALHRVAASVAHSYRRAASIAGVGVVVGCSTTVPGLVPEVALLSAGRAMTCSTVPMATVRLVGRDRVESVLAAMRGRAYLLRLAGSSCFVVWRARVSSCVSSVVVG